MSETKEFENYLELKKNRRIRKIKKITKIILFTHHPECPPFDNDVINIRGYRFCTGCFIALPIMLITWFIFPKLWIYSLLDFKTLFLSGSAIASLYLLFKLPFGKEKKRQYLSKAFVGIGGGLIFVSLNKLGLNPAEKDLLRILIQAIVVWSHLGLRGIDFYKTCKKCTFQTAWESCPGFNEEIDVIEI